MHRSFSLLSIALLLSACAGSGKAPVTPPISPPPPVVVTPPPPVPPPPAPPKPYRLTLYFTCTPASPDPCEPPYTTTADLYANYSACTVVGEQWMKPASNPTNTVKTYKCDQNPPAPWIAPSSSYLLDSSGNFLTTSAGERLLAK